MKKTILVSLIVFAYIIFYKVYLTFLGQVVVYIINPVIWIALAITSHINLRNKRRKEINHPVDVVSIMTILSLIYVILFYIFGIVTGFTNNPYSTVFSGVIINLFSMCLVIYLKEYIRYLFINAKRDHYKKMYYFVVFIIFTFSDISVLNVLHSKDLLNLWSKELIIPIIVNLLMMYLSYISNYKAAAVSRIILILPVIFFSVVPDYEWFIIMAFNIIYCLSSYLILQYAVARKRKDLPTRLIDSLNPRKWITMLILILLTIGFGAGFFTFKPVVILTGSMRPFIKPGDLIIIKKCAISDVGIGDVIEYKRENYKIVHRVIAISYNQGEVNLIVKGDANKKTDKRPVTSDQFVGKLEYTIPYIGYPSYFIKNIGNNNKRINVEQGGDVSD